MTEKLRADQATQADADLGLKIRHARYVRDMTQQQLAAAVGVKFQQIQKYETGVNRVAATRLKLIADALGRTVGSFFGEGQP